MRRYTNRQIEPYTTGQRLALCMSHALTATSPFPPGRHSNEPPRNSHATSTSSNARVLHNQFCSIYKHGNLMRKKIAGGRRSGGRLQRQEEKILEKSPGEEEARKICAAGASASASVYTQSNNQIYIQHNHLQKAGRLPTLNARGAKKHLRLGRCMGLF